MATVRVADELYDDETGEFLGLADGFLTGVSDYETLVTYMSRLSRYEAEVRATEIQLEAVIENTRKLIEAKKRKVEWLRSRFERDATLVAHTLLPRNAEGEITGKTFRCAHGTVSYRTRNATAAVANEDQAIAWALANNPDAIKTTQKVLISKLPAKDWAEEGRCPDGFEIIPESESVTFKTIE
jgi:hypothetical protein